MTLIIKQLFEILTRLEKRSLLALFFLMIFSAILELFSILSIMPFMGVIAQSSSNTKDKFLDLVSHWFNIKGENEALIFAGFVVLFLLIFSYCTKAFTSIIQTKRILSLEYKIGERLLNKYLMQDYGWILNNHSSHLSKNLLSEIQVIVREGFLPLSQLISQSILALTIAILIIYLNPLFAISMALIVTFSYGILIFITSGQIKKISAMRLLSNSDRYKSVTEIFSLFKEIKLSNREDFYFSHFSISARKYSGYQIVAQLISLLPKFLFEMLVFGGLISLILFSIISGNKIENLLPLLAVYGFSAIRLLPALQQIFGCYAQIKYVGAALQSITDELQLAVQSKEELILKKTIQFKNNIELNSINFSYNNHTNTMIKNINLTINKGQSIAFIGPTGSGKTTLVDIILMLLVPQTGSIVVDGENLTKSNRIAWQSHIGYVPQKIHLSDNSIAENIAFGLKYAEIDWVKLKKAAQIAGLYDFINNELSESYDTDVGEQGIKLSGGQKQRIGIARALYKNPDILVLDEATSALDPLTENNILKSLQKLKGEITIIMIAHRYNSVKECDVIYKLEHGSIIQSGSFDEIIGTSV